MRLNLNRDSDTIKKKMKRCSLWQIVHIHAWWHLALEEVKVGVSSFFKGDHIIHFFNNYFSFISTTNSYPQEEILLHPLVITLFWFFKFFYIYRFNFQNQIINQTESFDNTIDDEKANKIVIKIGGALKFYF